MHSSVGWKWLGRALAKCISYMSVRQPGVTIKTSQHISQQASVAKSSTRVSLAQYGIGSYCRSIHGLHVSENRHNQGTTQTLMERVMRTPWLLVQREAVNVDTITTGIDRAEGPSHCSAFSPRVWRTTTGTYVIWHETEIGVKSHRRDVSPHRAQVSSKPKARMWDREVNTVVSSAW